MTKRQVLILVLAALLLTAFSVALSRRDSRDWRANRSRRLFPFPWQDAASVVIRKPDSRPVEFRKVNGVWQIDLGDDLVDTLDYGTVDALAALATLTWREPMADARPPVPGQAVVITASGAGQEVELRLGDSANNLRATVIDGDASVVYGVNQDLLKFIDWSPDRYRNLVLAGAGAGAKVEKVTLAPAGGDESLHIVLEREDAGWRLRKPVAWPVDESRLDILLRWLERLRAETIEAEKTGDPEWFGFVPESARIDVEYAAPAGKVKRTVEFGGDAGDNRQYVRVGGRNPVFTISRSTLAEISMDVAAEHRKMWGDFFRQRSLNSVGDELPASITVERLLPQPVKLVINQERGKDGAVSWTGTLESGEKTSVFPIEPPDSAEPMRPLTALLTGLSSLRVKMFLTDRPPGPETAKWTAHPAWRFRSKRADGSQGAELVLYAANADGALPAGTPYVEGLAGPQNMTALPGFPDNVGLALTMSGRDAVMETFGDLAYLLCLPPYRYHSRRLLDLNPRNWRRVEIAVAEKRTVFVADPDDVNEQWWKAAENGDSVPLMDDNNRFVSTLVELSQLRSEGFVSNPDSESDESMREFGLDQPEITAIVYVFSGGGKGEGDNKPLFKLCVGKTADPAGRTRYARLNDSGPVFVLSAHLAESLADKYR